RSSLPPGTAGSPEGDSSRDPSPGPSTGRGTRGLRPPRLSARAGSGQARSGPRWRPGPPDRSPDPDSPSPRSEDPPAPPPTAPADRTRRLEPGGLRGSTASPGSRPRSRPAPDPSPRGTASRPPSG